MNAYAKGTNGEREVVRVLNDAGLAARRVPMSGALPGMFGGCDVLVLDASGRWQRWEVKRRKGFGQIRAWLAKADVLAFRGDRDSWNVALSLTRYLALVHAAESPRPLLPVQVETEKTLDAATNPELLPGIGAQ